MCTQLYSAYMCTQLYSTYMCTQHIYITTYLKAPPLQGLMSTPVQAFECVSTPIGSPITPILPQTVRLHMHVRT